MKTRIEVLDLIAKNIERDAKRFEGAPFTGRVVAEYFGCQGAAIAALANILKGVVGSINKSKTDSDLSVLTNKQRDEIQARHDADKPFVVVSMSAKTERIHTDRGELLTKLAKAQDLVEEWRDNTGDEYVSAWRAMTREECAKQLEQAIKSNPARLSQTSASPCSRR